MKMTIAEVFDKVRAIEHITSELYKTSDDHQVCSDAAELLGEYRCYILNTKIDL